jgi:hypothetical protein
MPCARMRPAARPPIRARRRRRAGRCAPRSPRAAGLRQEDVFRRDREHGAAREVRVLCRRRGAPPRRGAPRSSGVIRPDARPDVVEGPPSDPLESLVRALGSAFPSRARRSPPPRRGLAGVGVQRNGMCRGPRTRSRQEMRGPSARRRRGERPVRAAAGRGLRAAIARARATRWRRPRERDGSCEQAVDLQGRDGLPKEPPSASAPPARGPEGTLR